LPIFRRLGFRTASEIDRERYALKALRGDFEELPVNFGQAPASNVQSALAAARP
jgi:hypothetical protein